ncbi:tetratricopeptide repeat protein [Actinoplanes aureus]|uniref:Tetratricopeptide repeat protein n=1 Tax=Actinoplanes aureus TaxID=2792083 RepID=A0A931CGZ0_9ACTN|nr:tetratricopeptide repeat protein [Actinoplanes aureus]MBG0567812.1 tetratricopeptide repeat protein [Actinoplanes aureus]
MRSHLVAQVSAAAGGGSGFRIARRLILTSAHVVGATSSAVDVVVGSLPQIFPGTVVWRGTPGGRDDAALVEITGDAPAGHPDRVRWGRLATGRPRTPCDTSGFPGWVRDANQRPEVWHSSGFINPGSGFYAERYVMTLDGTPPTANSGSPWRGLSGAALFSDRLLTGVVAADRAAGAHGHLFAVPVYAFGGNPGFLEVLARHRVSAPVLEPIEMQELAETEPPRGGSVAAFLRARDEVVAFRGQREPMRRLQEWATAPGARALLLHGPGGQGKTRVAQELCRRLSRDRWATLWLAGNAAADKVEVIADVEVPLLLVVDYAESRLAQLPAVLRAAARHDGARPLRLLLLARTAGQWWDDLKIDDPVAEEVLEQADTLALPPLELDTEGRGIAYETAVVDLARAMVGLPSYQQWDPDDLAGRLRRHGRRIERQATALALHMTALADLLDEAESTSATGAADAADDRVEDRLLRHERRHWRRAAQASAVLSALAPAALEDVLAVAMLLGAQAREHADTLLDHVEALNGSGRDVRRAVRDWIAALYPPPDNRYWGILQPDRLVERFVAHRLGAEPRLLDPLVPVARPAQLAQLIDVFARAVHHPGSPESLGRALTDLCIRYRDELYEHVAAAAPYVEESAPLVAALQQILLDDTLTLDDLRAYEVHLPSPGLLPGGLLIDPYTRLISGGEAEEKARGRPIPEMAGWYSTISAHRRQMGDDTGAHEAATQAVERQRVLAASGAEEALARLGTFLNNLAVCQSRLGQRVESLEAVKESYRIHRTLVEQEFMAHLPGLAHASTTLANRFADLGDYKRAVDAGREAVSIWRGLADGDSGTCRPMLAAALTDLSVHLSALRRNAPALLAAEEAVRILRELTAERPAVPYQASLARALTTYANRLGLRGRIAPAMAAAEEAAMLYRRLVGRGQETFRPNLAFALNNLAMVYTRADRNAQAANALQTAIGILRVLAKESPGYQDDLERALRNLAGVTKAGSNNALPVRDDSEPSKS